MANREKIKGLLDQINLVLATSTAANDGFLGGMLGTIFYNFQYSQVFDDEQMDTLARNQLNDYIEKLTANELRIDPFSYCNGLAGFAYAISHLNRTGLVNIDMEDEFSVIDAQLFNSAIALIADHHNDFLHGAFGIIHYFSGREQTTQIKIYIDQLIKSLYEKLITVKDQSSIANLSLPSNQVQEKVNLSLSHGLNGFLLILLNLIESSTEKKAILAMIDHCSKIIFDSYGNASEPQCSKFPASVHLLTGEKKYSNRLGWCYGDLGQLLLFHRLNELGLLPEKESEQLKHLATVTVARKTYEDNLVEDANFCHGAAGLAQFYAALHQVSGHELYASAYAYWINETVVLLSRDLQTHHYNSNEHSILDGLSGIGLTLLAYLAPAKAAWGQAVLLA